MRKTDNYSLENLDMIDLKLPRVLQKDAKLITKEIGVAFVFATKNDGRLAATPLQIIKSKEINNKENPL